MEIDGKIHKGICKNTTRAREDYDDAIASGFGAFMVEQGESNKVCVLTKQPKETRLQKSPLVICCQEKNVD